MAGSEFFIGYWVIQVSKSGTPYSAMTCCEAAGACAMVTFLTAGPG